MSGNAKKLRILCMHGFYQNGSLFRNKTGSFRKYFKKLADFEFVDAPHKVETDVFAQEEAATNYNNNNTTTTTTTTTTITTTTEESGNKNTTVETVVDNEKINNNNNDNNDATEEDAKGDDLGPLAWWHTVGEWLTTPVYPGVDQSIKTIENFIKEKGPFDGLLGFSQGGVFASLLANSNIFNFKFVIICSAFVPSVPEFKTGETYNTIPSLHFFGRGDTLVSPLYGKKLASLFHDSISFEHKGGHFVPTDSESKKIFRDFLEKFVKEL